MAEVDVVVPIYGSPEATLRCLRSVLEYRQRTPMRLILVDDATPDPHLRRALGELAGNRRDVLLLRNSRNRGYVAAVNRGMRASRSRDIVLLNSDAEVANDWLDRLVHWAYSDPSIGTVTPFSNNATICSFPRFCEENSLPDGWSLAELDGVFRSLGPQQAVDLPTAVGFCMYIKRRCLHDVGLFDEARFERGYGEENDFSMRSRRRGWRHVLATDTFVYHQGGATFGPGRSELIEGALRRLCRLHPSYLPRVQQHILEDPARPFRQAAALQVLRCDRRRRILAVLHDRGGGTQRHVRELALQLRADASFLTLRSPGEGRVELETLVPDLDLRLEFEIPGDEAVLEEVVLHLGIDRVHFHHTMDLPGEIVALPRKLGLNYDVTLHDYYLINGNPTLTDREGRYCWDRPDRDRLCARAYPLPERSNLAGWQERQGRFLAEASRVFAPSFACSKYFRETFPELDSIVVSHVEDELCYPTPWAPAIRPAEPLRVLVLGALSREKGADLLERCALLAEREGEALEFRLLGYAYRRLARPVHQSGPYDDQEVDGLIEAEDPHVIWFPAQWPETYSYTLSAALRSGRPILASAIGAFPERLTDRPLTWLEPWDTSPQQWLRGLRRIRSLLFEEPDSVRSWWHESGGRTGFSYSDDYLAVPQAERKGALHPAVLVDIVRAASASHTRDRSVAGLLATYGLRIAQRPVIWRLRQLLPRRFNLWVRKAFERTAGQRVVVDRHIVRHRPHTGPGRLIVQSRFIFPIRPKERAKRTKSQLAKAPAKGSTESFDEG